mmetsp:Transcript_44748/g.101978  ORF Transcript_44748/g.101978 Transcript_44748/m.101978 type:complete len:354 (-) Transcript_44748:37-1098(-)|eukprot:CAMPEP_0180271226 /NCGR_PEP_ID=MMETSP0988-20121125/3598_1 /TAXON_ID=697907 /ORGANISM="non described non described, Strain CCMP2293" /LENGTH=353 /DNA_ID=CAMNT_0022242215 /DNA_START=74 /DNA_END=1135 /DNA_ORIENTATION=-
MDFGTGPNGSTPSVCYRDILRAMRQELQLMQSLGKHHTIVEVLAATEDCRVFMLECAISDLYSIVKQAFAESRQLPGPWYKCAKAWGKCILAAVEYMHASEVVHQDVKSSNVLIFSDTRAKVCDFGLARRCGLEETMLVDRELVTLWYRPPELLMGERQYTALVDEWGAGCILLEMVIGASPFKGRPASACSCPEIRHRNYNSDQLSRIFKMVGTPRDRALLARAACTVHFGRWPHYPPRLHESISAAFSHARVRSVSGRSAISSPESAAQMWGAAIMGLLCIDHTARLTASAALALPLFGGKARSAEAAPLAPVASAPDVEMESLSVEGAMEASAASNGNGGRRVMEATVAS